MSDWQVGDIAVCVKKDAWEVSPHSEVNNGDVPSPRQNEYVTVGALLVEQDGLYLAFYEYPGECGYFHSSGFRKIKPDERKACEPEFITLLKRSKQREVA